ncbi:MAG: hypothetical protein ACKO4Z_15555 [Planctomycetota bacterium]
MAPAFSTDGQRPTINACEFIALCERLAAEHASRAPADAEARTRLALQRWRSAGRTARRRSGPATGRR